MFFRGRLMRHLLAAGLLMLTAGTMPAIAQEAAPNAQSRVGILSVTPKLVNFGKLDLKKRSALSRYITIRNKGKADLHVSIGSTTGPFVVACSCSEVTLPAHRKIGALISFQPTEGGRYRGTFDISSDGGKGAASVVVGLKGSAVGSPPASTASIAGAVTGNQSPIANATVNLFAAGDDQTQSNATLLFSTSTDAAGRFAISRITCPTPGSQIYLTSAGGTPNGCQAQNNALAFMAAIGTCSDLQNQQPVAINEMTTAASANALAPFVSNNNPPVVGSATTNSNLLANAFAEAQQNATIVPTMNSISLLSDVLAACAQCGGTTSAACQELLACSAPDAIVGSGTCSGGSMQTTDTLQAVMSMAGSPSSTATSALDNGSD